MNNREPGLITRLIVNTLSVFAVAWILPGVEILDFTTAIIIAVLLAVLNVTLKPILVLLTLPITIFTFGFFLLVINAVIIFTVAGWVDGFYVSGFWWAVLFSFLISAVNGILYRLGDHR